MSAKNWNKSGRFEDYRLTAELHSTATSRILLGKREVSGRTGNLDVQGSQRVPGKQEEREQSVILKWFYTTSLATPQEQERFLREIHSLKQLHDPTILPLLFAGFHESTPYLVMEYASRGTLADRLQPMQPMFYNEAAPILEQVGRALHYAHQWNITHGNLKPQNIFFNASDAVLVADFHLTTIAASAPKTSFTGADTSVYMAPELATGPASPKSDLYALGCVAYEMLTGRKPFLTPSATTPGVFYRTKTLIAPRAFNPTLTRSVESALLKALAREPEQRYADIPAFLSALDLSSFTYTITMNPRGEESAQELEDDDEETAPAMRAVPAKKAETAVTPPPMDTIDAAETTEKIAAAQRIEEDIHPVLAEPAEAAFPVAQFVQPQLTVQPVPMRNALVPRASPALPDWKQRFILAPLFALVTYLANRKRLRASLPAFRLMGNDVSRILHTRAVIVTGNRAMLSPKKRLALVIATGLIIVCITSLLTFVLLVVFTPHVNGVALSPIPIAPFLPGQSNTPGQSSTLTPVAPPTASAVATTQADAFTSTKTPAASTPSSTTVSTTATLSTNSPGGVQATQDQGSGTSSGSQPTAVPTQPQQPTPVPTRPPVPTPTPRPTPTPLPPTPTPTPFPTPTPTPRIVQSCAVNYAISGQWPGGFNADITITNMGTAPINGWTLTFSMPDNQRITNGWNGRISQRGNQVTISDAGYNAQIAAGSSTNPGIQGQWYFRNGRPSSFTLNGMRCQ